MRRSIGRGNAPRGLSRGPKGFRVFSTLPSGDSDNLSFRGYEEMSGPVAPHLLRRIRPHTVRDASGDGDSVSRRRIVVVSAHESSPRGGVERDLIGEKNTLVFLGVCSTKSWIWCGTEGGDRRDGV